MTTFEQLVMRMRTAQKNYFRTATGTRAKSDYLKESRILEQAVDQMLLQMNAPEPQPQNQVSIFDQIPEQ